jgi:hypothetical protein
MCNWAYQWYNPKGPQTIEDISEYFADLAEASVTNPNARKSGQAAAVSKAGVS